MTTDSDDFPGDDDKRRASDPTQRATRPGKRTTLGVRRDRGRQPARRCLSPQSGIAELLRTTPGGHGSPVNLTTERGVVVTVDECAA